MDALDLLLGNEELLRKPQKKFIIKRLSKDEAKFELTLEAIHMDTLKHIQELNTKGPKQELDSIDVQISMMTYGVREFNVKVDGNAEKIAETCKRLGVSNAEQLIIRILLPGEIAEIANAITELSGFGGDTIEEVKNV